MTDGGQCFGVLPQLFGQSKYARIGALSTAQAAQAPSVKLANNVHSTVPTSKLAKNVKGL